MQNIKEAFGANLRKIRKSRKLTVDAFAEMADITPRLLSKIEAGDTFLSVETLCKISVALDLELQVLFDFDWYDKLIYYDDNKYIKPHFKAVLKNKIYELKSLPQLKGFKINKKMPIGKLTRFLLEFAKKNNTVIYMDFFKDKTRDKIIKYMPDDTFSFLFESGQIKEEKIDLKDKRYYEALERIRELAEDKKKIEYIITATDALSNKKSREKLRIMLDAMDISK